MRRNQPLVNWANGEWAPLMSARVDSPEYQKSLAWCQNFIVIPQGGLRYRPGNAVAGLAPGLPYLIPFQFSASDAIVIEATDSLFRFYRNGGLILNNNVTITGISQASPGVVTAAAHGFSNGQQVYISQVWGMPQVNDRFFIVAGATTNTFQLQDQFGNNVNTAAYNAYTSNGTVASVYTVATPYLQNDLPLLRYAQVGDIMYIVHPNYAPRKLTRLGFTNWTLATFTRTNDPFTLGTTTSITNVATGASTTVTVASMTSINFGDVIEITGVVGVDNGVGKSVLNKNTFTVGTITGTSFILLDVNGNPINTARDTAYVSGGTVTDANNYPAVVCFTSDGRIDYGCSRYNPQGLWGSQLPGTTTGGTYTPGTTTNYDNFGTGAVANDAYAYQFAPVNGVIDDIQEMKSFGGMISLLGASSIQQIYGASTGQPPNPTAIGSLPTIQGAARVQPIGVNQTLLFVDINQLKLRGLQFNFYYSTYEAVDYNLDAPHLGEESQFIKMVHVKGTPEIVWVLRADGVLLSFTFSNFDPKDPLGYKGAWARHYVGGGGSVVDICSIRNSNGDDQLYTTVQRTLNGQTYYTVEAMTGWAFIAPRRSFFTGNKASDMQQWQQAAWEQLKLSTLLDMSLTYDGRERGVQTNATITPSATTGNITITASSAVFQPSDVGTQLWKLFSPTGSGGGQCQITGYISSTQVTAQTIIPFDTTAAIAPLSWAFAIQNIVNLQLFAGQTVNVQADGGAHPPVLVTANGLATLMYPCSIVNFGFSYTGLAATQNLDFQTELGSGGSKPRNVKRVRARLDNSFGGAIGTDEYDTVPIINRMFSQPPNMPPLPFTGSVDLPMLDSWSDSIKAAVIYQQDPTPLTLLGFDVEMDTIEAP